MFTEGIAVRAVEHYSSGFLLRQKHRLCEVQHRGLLLREQRGTVEFAAVDPILTGVS